VAGDDGRVSLRERKKLATRQALEEAALRLFAEKGFDQVTVGEIAASVGVSSRTFFRYFGSKEEVVLEPRLELHRFVRATLAGRPPDEPVLDALRFALESLAHRLEEFRPRLFLRSEIVRRTPALAAREAQLREDARGLLTDFAAARLAAEPATDLRPHVAAAWAMAGLSAARELWEHGALDRDLPSLLGDAYLLLSSDLDGTLAQRLGRPRSPAAS
jgi:AcrR family transcriptional regulator